MNSNKRVYIVNGRPRAGKGTLIQIMKDNYPVHHLSTVDTVKVLARQMGWNGTKTPENRQMLSDLKDFYSKNFDGPFREMTEATNSHDYCVFEIREPKEIERLQKWCELNWIICDTILVQSDKHDATSTCHSDVNVDGFDYRYIVNNYNSLDDYEHNCKEFLKSIMDEDEEDE